MHQSQKSMVSTKSKYKGVAPTTAQIDKIVQKVLEENKHFIKLLEKL